MTRELDQLRHILDSNDPFMTGGHQIIKSAGATRYAERMLRVPSWAMDDNKIRDYIRSRFPKMATDEKQRARAGRIVRIINLYYRVGYTRASVAEELHLSPSVVGQIIYRLERAMLKPAKKPGRPKKNIVTIQTPSGTGRR